MRAKLTQPTIEELEPAEKMYKVWDTDTKGFFLRVLPSGRKTFALFYRHAGKGRDFTLGPYGKVSPEQAEIQAKVCLASVAQGMDICKEKKVSKPNRETPTFEQFLEGPYAEWVEQHRVSAQRDLRLIRSEFDYLFNKKLSEVCPDDIEQYQDNALRAGRKPSTINRRVSRLKHMFSNAQTQGAIAINPLAGLVRLKEERETKLRFLSSTEVVRLREALDERETSQRADRRAFNIFLKTRGRHVLPELDGPFTDHLKPMVLLALTMGLKRAELFALDWSHVAPRSRLLRVQNAAGETRDVSINEEAFNVLRMWRNQHQPPSLHNGLIFPSPKTGRQFTNIGSAWSTLIDLCDLAPLRFQDLRNTFAVNQLASGVDLKSLAQTLGQADLKSMVKFVEARSSI